MTRVTHYLKGAKNSENITNILIVDTETNIEKIGEDEHQTFRLGYAIHITKQKEG